MATAQTTALSAGVAELAPRTPAGSPTHLFHLLQSFDEAVRVDAPNSALRALRQTFGFLLGHFTDLVAAVSVELGATPELFLRTSEDLVSVGEAEGRLREGLHFISVNGPDHPAGKLLISVFFFESGEPREFYALTQGAVGGLPQLSEFCKEPRRAPSRAEIQKLRAGYIPHVLAWLEAGSIFWKAAERVWERTALNGRQTTLYRVLGIDMVSGYRCDLLGCKACVPSRIFEIPDAWLGHPERLGLPQEVPEHTLHLADRFAEALQQQDAIASTNLLRDLLEFLLRYFAGVARVLTDELNCFPDEARRYARDTTSVDNCEALLKFTVEALLGQQDDPAARAFAGVFYRRNELLTMEPRAHTDILLLEGVLSAWFKQERGQTPSTDRALRDFDRYYPLLRDWVSSMGGYFAQTEHFDEPPSADGILPLTVRLGERLLELTEPAYRLRIRQCPVCLPNPSWLVKKPASGQLGPAPTAAPATADTPAASVSAAPVAPAAVEKPVVRAGISADENRAAPGEFRPIDIPPDAPKFFSRMLKRLDIHLRRGELIESWAAMRDTVEYLVRYWAGVTATITRSKGSLTSQEADLMESSLSIQDCERLLQRCLQSLSDSSGTLAIEATRAFYSSDTLTLELKPNGVHTRMLLKDANPENKFQLLAELCEKEPITEPRRARSDLKTYLPVVRDWLRHSQPFFEQCIHHEEEPDSEGRLELVVQFDQEYLELVAPDYAFYVRRGSDQVPDLPVPEWIEPAEPVHEEQAVVTRRMTQDDIVMAEPILGHKVAFVGMQNNSKGKLCKSGIIKVWNAGSGSLTGRAFSTHPCIEISPARFRDNQQLTYWLDDSAVPRDFTPLLVLRAGGDERHVTVPELRPLGNFNTIRKHQAMALLAAPGAICMIFFSMMLLVTYTKVRQMSGLSGGDINQIEGEGQLVSWTLLTAAVATPSIAYHFYKKLPLSLQDLLERYFSIMTMNPTIIFLIGMVLPVYRNQYTHNKDLPTMDLVHLTPWVIFFNLAAAGHVQLMRSGKIAEWMPDPNLRRIIPAFLIAVFIAMACLATM